MVNVFLLLGSNLGDRPAFLQQAIYEIELQIAPLVSKSSIYETQAWGNTTDPDYLNQVILVQTVMPAPEILQKILKIELDLGRQRLKKWGSRTIDIDILFYGDEIINNADLTVPHPQLHNRRFTLAPLVELAPEFVHPVLKKDMASLKNDLQDCLIVKKL